MQQYRRWVWRKKQFIKTKKNLGFERKIERKSDYSEFEEFLFLEDAGGHQW